MPALDWDDAYANAAHIPGGETYPARWAEAAARFRDMRAGRDALDLAYGPSPRQRLDLFLPEGAPQGLVVFVHGGYWLAFDKSSWSHLAAGPLGRGWAVALPSYDLCPEVRISAITRQIGAAVALAASRVAGPLVLTGHSAGGHLASRLACADGPLAPALGGRLARVVPISGLFDLRPLLRTALNATLRLDAAEAAAESPALGTPRESVALTAWVGAEERPELRRQSALIANIWAGLDAATRLVEAPGRHHFDVIAELGDPASALCAAVCGG